MKLFFPKETNPEETRVALLPVDAGRLASLGAQVGAEAGIGESLSIPDEQYEAAGAQISEDRGASLSSTDMVLRISVPSSEDIRHLKEGCLHVSFMEPFRNFGVVRRLAGRKVSGISLEMIPRTTIAQKMDVLSSQANLGGYVAVVLAAERQERILPMMMTPCGTIAPARVFVIGAGVAGLQAIATAKRLGARVDAFDVRAEAREQIMSLGAKAVDLDLGQTGQTKDGYAKRLTDEQLRIQQEAMAELCAKSDVVIAAAQVFGRKAPLIVTNKMLDGMKPGSVVVDLAVATGGNVESSVAGQEIRRKGVLIIGRTDLERHVPASASQMFSSNLYNFIEHFWDKEARAFVLDRDNEIIQDCLVTHGGEIVSTKIKEAIG